MRPASTIAAFFVLALLHPVLADYTNTASSTCTSSSEDGSYDLGLHVASVFILLVASAIGVFTPVLFGAKAEGWVGNTFFALKYFGTGIIISLAFCHLLQDSFETFSNPCIGDLAYDPTAAAVAMGSALIIWSIDFFSARSMLRADPSSPAVALAPASDDRTSPAPGDKIHLNLEEMGCCDTHCEPCATVDMASKRAHWDVRLLEGGIVYHSVMIGVALGAQIEGFATTFAALVFHQLFEGLGLGARIGALTWRRTKSASTVKWSMCMVYAIITPVGIAIGIGVHESFNDDGRSELLAIGVLNAMSAGILLYSGLCQLLFAEWVVGNMRMASKKRLACAGVALVLGIFGMSLIGEWT